VSRASNPNAYNDKWLWQRDINIACALYKGYRSERNPNINERRAYQMALEREYNSRDYLYGRLLAISEQIERFALDNLLGENRVTSAERLMQRFSSKPFATWKIIEENLNSYKQRLRTSKYIGLLNYWLQEIEQVMNLFDHTTFVDNSPLSGEYLLGYYCQKNYRKPKESETV
jgi:CRISPR-associated protein Csd1